MTTYMLGIKVSHCTAEDFVSVQIHKFLEWISSHLCSFSSADKIRNGYDQLRSSLFSVLNLHLSRDFCAMSARFHGAKDPWVEVGKATDPVLSRLAAHLRAQLSIFVCLFDIAVYCCCFAWCFYWVNLSMDSWSMNWSRQLRWMM